MYTSLLMKASFKKGNLEIVKFILQNDDSLLDLEEETYYGNTALHYACSEKDNLDTIELLLERGANIYHVNRNGDILHTTKHVSLKEMNV